MMNSFLHVANSSTSDVSEIIRLSRMLWSEFVAVFDNRECNGDYQTLAWQLMCFLKRDSYQTHNSCTITNCSFCHAENPAVDSDFNSIKNKLLEKLDHNIRDTVRGLLANVLMMPGRVIERKHGKPYVDRLPYTTKFLLLAAFLCQQKRPERDVNLFTTINTGRRSNRGAKTSVDGTAYASSTSDLKQLRVAKIPSFHVERLLSVFTSIIGQYGRASHHSTKVTDMGTEELFKSISLLIAGGLLSAASNSNATGNRITDKSDFMLDKVTCNLSLEDARLMASSIGFPLDKYCL
jgi:hypothetical protein